MSPINRKPRMPMSMPSIFQSMGQSIGPTQLPAPAPMGGLMPRNLSDKSGGLMESPDDPMAVQADEESLAKQEAGFLPANMHCETCAHLDNAMCSKYGFAVADEDGCSQGYEPIDAVMGELESGEGAGEMEGMEGMESPGPEGELTTDEEESPTEETNPVSEEPEEPEESEERTGKGRKKPMKPGPVPGLGKGGK